jgi:hypothetical protein
VHILSGDFLFARVALFKTVLVEPFPFSLGECMPFSFGIQNLVFKLLNKGAERLVLKVDAMFNAQFVDVFVGYVPGIVGVYL